MSNIIRRYLFILGIKYIILIIHVKNTRLRGKGKGEVYKIKVEFYNIFRR